MVEIIEPENKLAPVKEKTKMKVPSLQDLVTANLNAATNAAKLELGAVAPLKVWLNKSLNDTLWLL